MNTAVAAAGLRLKGFRDVWLISAGHGLTHWYTATFYLLLAWEMAAGAIDMRAAITLGMIYGIARGIPAVLGGISVLRGEYPLPVSNWLIAHLGWWHAINGLLLVFIATFLLGSFVL